jgi:hypothetical protein
LNGTPADDHVLRGSLAISKLCRGHVIALFSRADPRSATVILDDGISTTDYRDAFVDLERDWHQAAALAFRSFQTWRTSNDIPFIQDSYWNEGPTAEWQMPDVFAAEAVNITEFGRVADILVSSLPTQSEDEGLEAALFSTGRPVLLVPECADPGMANGRVLIAWNGSVEASHAVAAALPLLTQAEDVIVLTIPGHGVEPGLAGRLVTYLQWHGVQASVLRPGSGGANSMSGALFEAIEKTKANLLIMGAYTHSRMRERFFGGVTKHVLNKVEIPVLMAH